MYPYSFSTRKFARVPGHPRPFANSQLTTESKSVLTDEKTYDFDMPNDMDIPQSTSTLAQSLSAVKLSDSPLESRVLPREFYDQFLSKSSKGRIEDPSQYHITMSRNVRSLQSNR